MVGSKWTWTRGLAVVSTLGASLLMGTNVMAADEAPASSAQTSGFSLNPFALPENFGWLSDPKTPAQTIGDALFGGKFSMNNRLRWEHVSQSGKDQASAITNRTRFGYGTKPLNGLSFYTEMENNTPFDRSGYWGKQTSQGPNTKAVVADPEAVELNQAYLKYSFKGDFKLDLIAGRQRIIIDDARFVGNVGWRQMEQTFDAVNLKTDLGIKKFSLNYIYIWQVNRIFTEEATQPGAKPFDSKSHLVRGTYAFCDAFKVTGFGYLLDLKNAGGSASSSATYGVLAGGKVKFNDTLSLVYNLTYARQSDYADNPTSYDADFFAGDGKLVVKDMGFGGAGYQLLGSDSGVAAFQFPLGTNHAFNGWADLFLTTPAEGLKDFYVYAGTTLPWNIKGKIFYHDYEADQGGDLGSEINIVLTKKFNKNWSTLVKFADYNGVTPNKPDTTKFWMETTFSF